ncbi:LysE family translocator [Erythrobacter mangrovi]|uniref:LysE family translocator n=1 Tax=Erythrobacter mangrovi TaxID=2739433 RepID=A0A7D4C6U1_9SPHN|nr:LysE family translocator [Erythrobacter mangrovi]QKG72725.1 LysE family translocator [Erythrobacter mangrovi]
MPSADYLIAFTIAAAFLTIVPGLDSALVMRTATVESARRAFFAGLGIAMGCVGWGAIVGAGLGALLAASEFAYIALKWCGALYLFYLGVKLIRSPRKALDEVPQLGKEASASGWFLRGFLTNMLNPKVGVFYVSFLPQFIPVGAHAFLSSILLGTIHGALGVAWFAILIAATQPIAKVLRKPAVLQWLDRLTGGVFLAFGARLLLSEQR